jgi:biopolymer transport protein TolR
MKAKAYISSMKHLSEISLTPLMDLSFLLLVTFIITFPLVEKGIPVQLPVAKASEVKAPDRAHTVSVDEKGKMYLNDLPVDEQSLRQEMIAAGQRDPSVSVLVRADERLAYGAVVKVLRILHEAKIVRMALVTRE